MGTTIQEVALVAPGNVTHGLNFSQRRVLLEFEADGSTITATAPWTPEVAPPGVYLLFILTDDGVPSEGKFVKLSRATSTAQTGSKTVWGGTARLDRDFTVEPGDTLQVLPGTEVICKPDDAGDTDDPALIELVVQGMIEAIGTAPDPITFTEESGSGHWYGLRCDVGTTTVPGYGFQACIYPISRLDHVVLDRAQVGLQVENVCAPSISNLTVTNGGNILGGTPAAPAGIYLKDTDVEIPLAYWNLPPSECVGCGNDCDPECGMFTMDAAFWNLAAPLNVVASNTVDPAKELGYGNPGRSDLIGVGALTTTGDAANRVVFRPLVQNDDTADDWGGISLDAERRSELDWAEVSHAAVPVFLFYPDSLAGVKNTKIHHFQDVGIWVQGSKGSGGLIEGTRIERGANLNTDLGNEGLFLDQASHLRVEADTLQLTGTLEETGAWAAIRSYYGKLYCLQAPSGGSDTLRILGSLVEGNGEAAEDGDRSGIHLDWLCGSPNRVIEIKENTISDWNYAGLRFGQCGDIQVSCNRVERAKRAVDFQRNTEATGTSVRLKANRLAASTVNRHAVLQTDDALKLDLGPSGLNKGDNRLWGASPDPPGPGVYWIYEDDADDVDVLNARNTAWWRDTSTLVTSSFDQLLSTTVGGAVKVDTTNHYSTDPTSGCPSCVPGCGQQGTGAHVGLQQETAPEEPASSSPLASVSDLTPEHTFLSPPRPNPASRSVALDFGVGRETGGGHRITVYDVTGRRVKTLLASELAPGTYRVHWDGRGQGGEVVSSGVYFVRMSGPDFATTRKIIIRE